MRRLETRFGPPEAFEPWADGVIPPDRVLAFLEARASINELCAEVETMEQRMSRLARIDDQEDASVGEILDATGRFGGVAVNLTPWVGRFFAKRNRALLDAGIGLGEYAYVYTTVYRERYLDGSLDRELFSEDAPLSDPVRVALGEMLSHQLAAARRAGRSGAELDQLENEVAACERDPGWLPWRNGVPEATGRSLAGHRTRLEALFCAATAGIELDPDSRRALYLALE
jgi:hypothetical protein